MKIESYSFGSICIDGTKYEHDVIVDRGTVLKRKKKRSKPFRSEFGHTPLSIEEAIPWNCKTLIVGTGAYGALPVMADVEREARKRHVQLIVLPTPNAIDCLNVLADDSVNAVLHVTC